MTKKTKSIDATHSKSVSQPNNEIQNPYASQISHETHTKDASHSSIGIHETSASQSQIEPQMINAPNDFEWQQIRHLVDTYEDMQAVRKAEMNRARMLLYRRLKDLGYIVEEKKEEDEKAFGDVVSDELIQPALEKAVADGKINPQELEMIDENTKYGKQFNTLEKTIIGRFAPIIEKHPIQTEYLSHIKGIGILTSARLICYLGDGSKFDTISKLWAYSGYKVENGIAQKRKKGVKSNWNNKVKTLTYLLVDGFIKHRTKYREIYDNEKARLLSMHPEKVVETEKWDGIHKTRWNPGHLHAMAMRKTAKIFLANYWLFVRTLNKLPTRSPYVIEKLGHTTLFKPEAYFEK